MDEFEYEDQNKISIDDQNKTNAVSYDIPTDYFDLLDFISTHKTEMLENEDLTLKILDALDSLLTNAKNISDLRMDASIMFSTIKMQYDSFLRAFQNNLSLSKLVDMENKNTLDDFYISLENKFMVANFIDQLNFDYELKELRTKATKKVYDQATSEVIIAADAVMDDNEDAIPIAKIKNIVYEMGQVEYFRLIVDPSSYSKTVINAFNLALAIRTKSVSLVNIDGIMYVSRYVTENSEVDHSALELTPQKLNEIIKKLRIKGSML